MGNCVAPNAKRNQKGMKHAIELKEGEQIITYNGKPYKINVQDIYQKKESPVHNNHLTSEHFQFLQKQHCSSVILDRIEKKPTAPTRDCSILHVNGKNQEFVLQTVHNSSLHARRVKCSLNDLPTTNALSPLNENPSLIINHIIRNQMQHPQQIHAH